MSTFVGPRAPQVRVTHRRDFLIALVVVTAVAAVISAVVVTAWPRTVPQQLPLNIGQVTQVRGGAPGCTRSVEALCFRMPVGVAMAGVELGDLQFSLLNTSTSGGAPGNVSVGPGAGVAAESSTGVLLGTWNFSQSGWVEGGAQVLPLGTNFTLILDTGLLTSSYYPPYSQLQVTTSAPMFSSTSALIFWMT